MIRIKLQRTARMVDKKRKVGDILKETTKEQMFVPVGGMGV
jgi:hypothetical protein